MATHTLTTPTTRRALFTRAMALLTVTAAGTAAAVAHPDADLIRICAQHIVNNAACEANPEFDSLGFDFQDHPLWIAYQETLDAIDNAEPKTIDGMLAIARAAKMEAQNPDGTEEPGGGPAETWAWNLVNDLLRLHGDVSA